MFEQKMSLYPSDMAFYSDLVTELKCIPGGLRHQDAEVKNGEVPYLEVTRTGELDEVLFDMPAEAKPSDNVFRLTDNKAILKKYIDESRKSNNHQWSQFQPLYDLHPIIQYWLTKLTASIPKNQAMVVRNDMFRKGSAYYLLYGSQSNGAGQSIISKFFVVNICKEGTMIEQPVSLADFVAQRPEFTGNLYQGGVTSCDLEVLQQNLKMAVESGVYYYMYVKQNELSDKMAKQREQYSRHLTQWFNRSKDKVILDFGEAPTTLQRSNLDKRIDEIQTIADKESTFYKNLTTLDNTDPYVKVLAVFYNF